MVYAAQILMNESPQLSTTLDHAKQIQSEIIEMRRHFHAHPELNFVEHMTSEFAAHRLRQIGFQVTTFAEHTGLIADFGRGEVVVALRTDMDASAVPELNRVIYASKNEGVMHACGHDANLACTLGAAQLLTNMPVSGRIRIIVQPGDDLEGKLGCVTMMESGCLDGVSAILGLHVDATIASQKIGVVSAATKMSEQNFCITLEQHDLPRYSVTLELARIICALAKLPVFAQSDMPLGEVALTSVQSEKTDSIAEITGALMTFCDQIRLQAQSEIVKVVHEFEPTAAVTFGDNNRSHLASESVIEVLRNAAVDLVGSNNVLDIKRNSWNAQFSLLTEHVPGAMIYLGSEIGSSRRTHQSRTFDIDESCLPVGAAVLAETALRLLDKC